MAHFLWGQFYIEKITSVLGRRGGRYCFRIFFNICFQGWNMVKKIRNGSFQIFKSFSRYLTWQEWARWPTRPERAWFTRYASVESSGHFIATCSAGAGTSRWSWSIESRSSNQYEARKLYALRAGWLRPWSNERETRERYKWKFFLLTKNCERWVKYLRTTNQDIENYIFNVKLAIVVFFYHVWEFFKKNFCVLNKTWFFGDGTIETTYRHRRKIGARNFAEIWPTTWCGYQPSRVKSHSRPSYSETLFRLASRKININWALFIFCPFL